MKIYIQQDLGVFAHKFRSQCLKFRPCDPHLCIQQRPKNPKETLKKPCKYHMKVYIVKYSSGVAHVLRVQLAWCDVYQLKNITNHM